MLCMVTGMGNGELVMESRCALLRAEFRSVEIRQYALSPVGASTAAAYSAEQIDVQAVFRV